MAHKTELVRVRVDPQTKTEAVAVLEEIGLTVSEALRLMLIRVAREGRLPFDPLIPNYETVAAMTEARQGGLPRFATVEDLMADLDADD